MGAFQRFWDRYLALLTAGTFRTDETGATVFFPVGNLGKGYIVSDRQADAIRRYLVTFYAVVLVVSVIGAQQFGLATLVIIPPVLAVYWLWSRQAVAGRPVSSLRMTSADANRRAVQILGRRWLIVVFLGSIAMTVASVGILLTPKYELVGLLGIVVFGLAAYRWLRLLIRYRHDSPDPAEPLP